MNIRALTWEQIDPRGLLLVLLVVACGILFGMVAGSGILVFQIGLVAMLAALVFAFRPRLLFWAVLYGALVAAGLIRLYLPQLQAFRWLVAVGTIALPFLIFVHVLFERRRDAAQPMPPFAAWALAYFIYAVFVAFALSGGLSKTVLGLKDYFQAWGLLPAFLLLPLRPGFRKALLLFILAVGIIQVPFALHQYFYLAPLRAGIAGVVPADIVAGTFGGDMRGGGNNAAMAAYQFFCIANVLGLWKYGRLGTGRMLALIGYLAVPVFLNETKVSFLFAILVFGVIFWDEIRRNPGRFLQAAVIFAALLAVFVMFYVFLAGKTDRIHGLGEYLDLLVEHNLHRGYGTYQLNRLTALSFWFSEHVPRDLFHALVGHGLSQTREASAFVDIGTTLAAKRYAGMGIGVTAMSGLLWEIGLIGTGLVVALFVSAFRFAGRLAHASVEPVHRAFLKGTQAAIAVTGLSLMHKSLFMFEITYQVFVVLLFGYLAYAFRQSRVEEAGRLAAESRR